MKYVAIALAAWNLIPPNEPRDYLFPFLGKITRHLAIDVCRRRGSEKRSALFCELTKEMEECLPSLGGYEVESAVEAGDLSRMISEFLEGCGAQQQYIFVRRYWYFDSIAEISRKCGCSQSKVKMTLFRMRDELREKLRKEGFKL